MDINSINQIGSAGEAGGIFGASPLGAASEVPEDDTYSFESVFTDALDSVKETSQKVTEEAYKLATGQTENMHDITIASTQANLAVQLFVQIRNKTLSAYQELMNMQI